MPAPDPASASSTANDLLVIDGLQYVNWNRELFTEARDGGVNAIHVTIAYWENTSETLDNIDTWQDHFRNCSDLVMPVSRAEDVLDAQNAGKVGIILGLQNCSPIEDDLSKVSMLHEKGVRFMQLSYNNQSLLATGCYEKEDAGITRFGREVIREMNRVGMVIDMSHSAEKSTLEAIDHSQRPIAITHANPSFFHPALRNKSDQVLQALAESGGMLGFSLYPFHLRDGSDCSLESFCEMVARTVDMLGINHVGLGTDLCQNWEYSTLAWMRSGRWSSGTDHGEGSADDQNWPRQPDWFRNSSDFNNLVNGLTAAGFDSQDIAKIMGINWLEFFQQSFEPS